MNYFNYFTEIEERFQQRRGSLLMLSTLDWALIETWREAGIPLETVLRGIDNAFDNHDAKVRRATVRTRKVNGLAWCAQTVMEAGERAAEAAVGIASASPSEPIDTGFEADRVARYLLENGQRIEASRLPSPADQTAAEIAVRLRELAATPDATHSLEDLDRTLGVFEEKLFAALLTGRPRSPACRAPRTGCPRARSLSRQNAGGADQAGAAAVPAEEAI